MASIIDLEVISPERTFYKGQASMVEFNTTEGYIGIYPNHIPLAVIVEPGILVIHEEEGEKKAAIHAGFAKITQDKVTIFAEIAEWPEEIDVNRAKEAQIRAERRLDSTGDKSGIDMARAEAALKRSLTRISLKS